MISALRGEDGADCSFYADLDRMFKPDYVPSDQDTLHLRAKTTGEKTRVQTVAIRAVWLCGRLTISGISETNFNINDLRFIIVDVGGQRSERRKWASCFGELTHRRFYRVESGERLMAENVTSILFLVSLADYNACIIEDRSGSCLVRKLM